MTDEEVKQYAVQASDLLYAHHNDLSKIPNWLYEPFFTERLHISEGAVYIGGRACREDDWIVKGLDGNLIICSSENFERIRKMLHDQKEREKNE